MAWTSRAVLAVVELTIYLPFIPLLVYTFSKHRKPSLTGHIYFALFILIRIITDGMTISQRNNAHPSTSLLVINSIGLSPLLLATAGFIGEAYNAQSKHASPRSRKVVLIAELALHLLVIAGVGLLADGSVNAAEATNTSDRDHYQDLAKAGGTLILLAWVAICGATILTLWASKNTAVVVGAGGSAAAQRLAMAIAVALVFLGVRVLYTFVYVLAGNGVGPTAISFAGYLFLVFLSQLLCALVLVMGLVVTRDIWNW